MKKSTNGLSIVFIVLGLITTAFGVVSGFLYAYKSSVEQDGGYIQMLKETRNYQQVLRTEIQANTEKKMGKEIAWRQINKLSNRIEYLEHHINNGSSKQ